MNAEPILFLYGAGILLFIFGLEATKKLADQKPAYIFIYLVLSTFINYIGYESSYTNTDFTTLAYLPLALMSLSTLIILYSVFELLKGSFSDD